MVTQWPKGDEPADAVEAPVTATQLAPSKPEVGQHREHRPQEEGDRWEDRLWENGAVMSTCMQGDRWEDRLSHARHGADLVGSSADLVGSSAHPSAELVWPEHRRGKGGCGDGREEAEAHTEEEGAVEAERMGEHYHGRRVRRGLIDREVQKVQDEGAF